MSFEVPPYYKDKQWEHKDVFTYRGSNYFIAQYCRTVFIHSQRDNKTIEVEFTNSCFYPGSGKTLQVHKNDNFNLYNCIAPCTIIFKDDKLILPSVRKYPVPPLADSISRDNIEGFKVYDLKLNQLHFEEKKYYAGLIKDCNFIIILGGHYLMDTKVYNSSFKLVDTLSDDGELDRSNPVVNGKLNIVGCGKRYLYDIKTQKKEYYTGSVNGSYVENLTNIDFTTY